MISFIDIEDGLKKIKEIYFTNSKEVEDKFADYLVENINMYFDTKQMKIATIMQVIQKFRSWIHEKEELETLEYKETFNNLKNEEYNFIDGSPVPYGTRIGVKRKDFINNINYLELDNGILYA
ncbi:hypothetical protein CP985_14360 [Malaciobacter mytili LMG 24559]|uniref:Uncharacterized protein n=1 Tax=Malaciobacter mytili LMG 24559 TaxID=1032238 RepID=A0AAX2AB80_9BACT|nr:hypothetical protein [Malaciobacter mytili]AXH16327.1 hypothetical protein AMYT_a0027 [Malaciobacter mytili LMG 24559]RXK12387.1 hypothetical protein CP985_14360 [Malaciobacter mytili LMG 24559]